MATAAFASVAMDQLDSQAQVTTNWLWHGYLARGSVTLLVSLWKTGKTTLVTGLIRQLASGGRFLDLACQPAKVLVLSEESVELWAGRSRLMPIGPHARLMSRPFLHRPTPEVWIQLIDQCVQEREAGELDLVVVDPIATFLPGRGENDAATMLESLHPLHRLTSAGGAVLLLHHPRKNVAEEGSSARGSGALLAFVDIAIELHRFGTLRTEECRRRLVSRSRFRETPGQRVYEWDPDTGEFRSLDDPHARGFHENWEVVRTILAGRPDDSTTAEILSDWPIDLPKPPPSVMYDWLNRALAENLVRRVGTGRKKDPYRYRLPNELDEVIDQFDLHWLKGKI